MVAKSIPVVAFMDLLGTTYYAENDKVKYRENLLEFKTALTTRASLIKDSGKVYLFSDCAYLTCSNPQKLIDYLAEVRAYLLLQHLYIQAAIEPGLLAPENAGVDSNGVVLGTIFGADVAPVYAKQHALKGAAVRVSDDLVKGKNLPTGACVSTCHLPHPTNSNAECFWDIRFRQADVDRRQLESVLADCMRAKSVRRSAGTYYLSVLISMIRSVDWRLVNLKAKTAENDTGARHLFELLIRLEFSRHFGDLRGAEYVFFAMLDEVYTQCEHKPVCQEVREYIARRPRLMRRIEAVPAQLLSHQNRQKFLESTLLWSHLRDEPITPVRKRKATSASLD